MPDKNILQYWREKLGNLPVQMSDEYASLPIDSHVGDKCMKAIDAAAVLIEGTKSYKGRIDRELIKRITVSIMDTWYFG